MSNRQVEIRQTPGMSPATSTATKPKRKAREKNHASKPRGEHGRGPHGLPEKARPNNAGGQITDMRLPPPHGLSGVARGRHGDRQRVGHHARVGIHRRARRRSTPHPALNEGSGSNERDGIPTRSGEKMTARLLTITSELHDYAPVTAVRTNGTATWHCHRCGDIKEDQLKPSSGSTTPCRGSEVP